MLSYGFYMYLGAFVSVEFAFLSWHVSLKCTVVTTTESILVQI